MEFWEIKVGQGRDGMGEGGWGKVGLGWGRVGRGAKVMTGVWR